MTNPEKELAGKNFLIADLCNRGHEAKIERRPFRRGTIVVVDNQTAVTVLTRFSKPDEQDKDQYIFGFDPPRAETPFYAFVWVFSIRGVPFHEVYIVPSGWVIARSTQLHNEYISNNPNVSPRQPYTISLDDLQPFQNNWVAL